MAERGLCSRREADSYIERGLVFVNGEQITTLGTRAAPDAVITLGSEARALQAKQVTILLNKPMSYVSGQAEDGYTPASALISAATQVPDDKQRFQPAFMRGLAPAGRLDIDSTGLLVLTQDGRIARQLIGDESEIEKEYLVRVAGTLSAQGLKLLNHGLSLDDKQRFQPAFMRGLAPAGRLDIDSTGLLVLTQDGRIARQLIGDESEIEKEYLVRVAGTLSAQGLKLLNHGLSLDDKQLRPAKVSWANEDQLRFVLREGRKRQIRRMCELVGLRVEGLKRVRIGRIPLGDLPVGQWRLLREGEKF